MRPSVLFLGIGTALAGVIVAWITHARLEDRLRDADRQLRLANAQVARLTDENSRLSDSMKQVRSGELSTNESHELLRLRAKVTELERSRREVQSSATAVTNQRMEHPSESQPSPIQSIPRDAWSFAGYQTPQNALQSVMWAMSSGNVTAFWSSLTPEAQAAMTKQFEGKSESDIAAWLKREVAEVRALRLDRIAASSDTETTFTLSSTEHDDGSVKTRDEAVATFTKVGGEWKLNGL